MIGARRTVQPGDIGQGAQSDAAASLHQSQSLDDKGAVEPGQRCDIRYRSQSDQVQAEQKVWRQSFVPEAALAQFAVKRHQSDKDHARSAKRALPRYVVLAVGVDDNRLGEDLR